MTLIDLKDAIIGQYGALILVLFIIYAGYKRWWVWGWYAKELQEQNKGLQRRLDTAVGQAQQLGYLNQKTLDIVEAPLKQAEDSS